MKRSQLTRKIADVFGWDIHCRLVFQSSTRCIYLCRSRWTVDPKRDGRRPEITPVHSHDNWLVKRAFERVKDKAHSPVAPIHAGFINEKPGIDIVSTWSHIWRVYVPKLCKISFDNKSESSCLVNLVILCYSKLLIPNYISLQFVMIRFSSKKT